MDDYYYGDYPCDNCLMAESCDHWEAMFCCELCHYTGSDDCDNCNPMDI